MQIADAKVLVTGGSSGIGAALALSLAERGATVGIVGRRRDKLEAVRERCGSEARAWVTDLGDLDAAERVALEAWEAFGHLDVLVNNAAIPKRRPAPRLS
ncbi:MAG: SDR family oxidoreductase, partial [Acidimicrobiales bacterium]